MNNRAKETVAALACFGVASCAPADTHSEKEVFIVDECAPIVELHRAGPAAARMEGAYEVPDGMVEVYVGSAARLPDDCV